MIDAMIFQGGSRTLCYSRIHFRCNLSRRSAHRFFATKTYDPLRILFCGSDEFSIASLKALHKEHLKRPDLISSIDVVCRPAKKVGRNRKVLREVPIKLVASDLSLPVHQIDTFTGWTPPVYSDGSINLIVAVSFGLFVPPRILNGAKYGGLNVHPSLLPDLRGAAPLHHTLLAGRIRTGVTLQTLHGRHFDHGIILKQTPFPGIEIPDPESCTVQRLLDTVSPSGAQILVDGIKDGLFVPPVKPAGSFPAGEKADLVHAAKINTEDKHIDWKNWTWSDISRRRRVFGSLWSMATVPETSDDGTRTFRWRRLIITDLEQIEPPKDRGPSSPVPGLPFVDGAPPFEQNQNGRGLYVFTSDGSLIRIQHMKPESDRILGGFQAAVKVRMVGDQTFRLGASDYTLCYDSLH